MYYIYIIFFLSIILLLYYLFTYLSEIAIFNFVSDKENVPYVTIDDNMFTKEECEFFSQQIIKCPLVIDNPLNEGFKKSRGFIIKFTDEKNVFEHFSKNNIEYIYDIFMKIKHPKCNTFVFNTLIIYPEKKFQFSNKSLEISVDKIIDKSIERHYDCTISISEKWFPYRRYLPKCVNVIYIQIPNHFYNGQLELFNFYGMKNTPNKTIKPKLGRMVCFRGNLEHSVQSLYSDETIQRISLVFEQYEIPDNIKPISLFEINGDTDSY